MIKISIEGHGVFTVPNERVQELLNWLKTNDGAKINTEGGLPYDGSTLLNEVRETGVRVGGNAKPLPGTDYNFGGTWM